MVYLADAREMLWLTLISTKAKPYYYSKRYLVTSQKSLLIPHYDSKMLTN